MLTYCEVNTSALAHNMSVLRACIGEGVILAPAVKSNAYGHGLVLASRAFLEGGADWLCVNALYEAEALRSAGISVPIYILGYVGLHEIERALELRCRLVLYNTENFETIAAAAERLDVQARVHLKLETGNNRQGLSPEEALALARAVHPNPHVTLEGIASHFADIEDTTDHRYARHQMDIFESFTARLRAEKISFQYTHMANSAAVILMPETQGNMVRPGIASYGLWPSKETMVAALLSQRASRIELQPALTWRSKIAQVKSLAAGEFIGYGRTFRTTHPTRLAILPIGYYDGYPRALSNRAHVLIGGRRAPIRGRVCMNIIMADVTDIPEACLEGDAVLLGGEGEERISAELFAEWSGSISYEVIARINDRIERVVV